jgi:hypothetical protein
MSGPIYRGLKTLPANDDTMKSHRELNLKCNRNDCECWGTSVWISQEHVRHAQETQAYVRKWYIAEIPITQADGVIKRTSGCQPDHHTFWRDCTVDFKRCCTVIMKPIGKIGATS